MFIVHRPARVVTGITISDGHLPCLFFSGYCSSRQIFYLPKVKEVLSRGQLPGLTASWNRIKRTEKHQTSKYTYICLFTCYYVCFFSGIQCSSSGLARTHISRTDRTGRLYSFYNGGPTIHRIPNHYRGCFPAPQSVRAYYFLLYANANAQTTGR